MSTTRFHYLDDESIGDREKIARLLDTNTELAHSLQRLSAFQKQLLSIKDAPSVEEALDQMEVFLDEVVEFVYLRLYLRDDHQEWKLTRAMGPDDLPLDWDLVKWAADHGELSIIPLEGNAATDDLKSLLLMPLVGHGATLGILAVWVEFDPTIFTQEQSTLLNMIAGEIADVMESQRFRQRLEQGRQKLQDVVESVPLGILAIDPSGTINLLNSTAQFMLGIRQDEALGQPCGEVLPKPVFALLSSMLDGTSTLIEEKELTIEVHGVEETLGVSASALRATESGDPQGNVILCRDLKLSREVAKLRELDAMKDDFLSLVSHELRTPLTSIMAYSETLLMEGMIDSDEERDEYIQIIYDEGSRLNRLINDVLDLTKLEAGKMDYNYSEHQIEDVIKNALASSRSLSTQKKIAVVTDITPDMAPLKLDSDRIMQVLLNLLSNAIKFTPEEGTVTVTAKKQAAEGRQNERLIVAVTDTGIGIAPEDINKVFSKFEQIENIDHHSVGTGLGMPICKQIIEEGHAGEIDIASEVGKGTTVSFWIPLD